MGKTLKECQQEVEQFLKDRKWYPETRDGRYYTMIHTMEELGEVSRCVTLLESKRGNWLDNVGDQLHQELIIELGDLLYHVFKLSSAYGIDAQHAFEMTMAKNNKKFPPEKFKDYGQH